MWPGVRIQWTFSHTRNDGWNNISKSNTYVVCIRIRKVLALFFFFLHFSPSHSVHAIDAILQCICWPLICYIFTTNPRNTKMSCRSLSNANDNGNCLASTALLCCISAMRTHFIQHKLWRPRLDMRYRIENNLICDIIIKCSCHTHKCTFGV